MLTFSTCLLMLCLLAYFLDQTYSNTRVPTQGNTNQHESDTIQHKSTRVRHESTRVWHESTRINTSQHESTRVQQKSTQVWHDSKRVNKGQLDHKIIIVYVFLLVKYDKSLIGLNITFTHELELGSKENQEQIEHTLDAIKVFINNFFLLEVK